MQSIKFEWHEPKAKANIRKHGVTFNEAATIFSDVYSRVYPDLDHAEDESRFLIIGMSESGRVLVVSHTDRGERTRIISARPATGKERFFYEENSQSYR